MIAEYMKRVDELENSLSIAMENVDKYQRDSVNLRKKIREAEGENEKLKAELARAKEDHQYDNLVHENELKSMKSKKHRMNQK
jgi:predicted RNase H-like nuclease (RuvC/YqgF family)